MKALSMLDHVMLWVARGFAAYAVFFAIINLVDGIIFFGSLLIATVLWLICTYSLHHRWARLFLGITSTISAFFFGALLLQFTSGIPYLGISELIFPFVGLLGSASLLWVSFHPPDNHPLPQSC
jgi:hypothetical protein